MLNRILMLGNPQLYQISEEVKKTDLPEMKRLAEELHLILMAFKSRRGAGRAIAAPQIGIMKRLIYMYIDTPFVFINPVLYGKSSSMIEIWDDCMCFPDLLVKVKRHKECKIKYRDLDWNEKIMDLKEDLSELLQHECDHLDGVLAVQRAIDLQSFKWKTAPYG
jgi:peptide deformylase